MNDGRCKSTSQPTQHTADLRRTVGWPRFSLLVALLLLGFGAPAWARYTPPAPCSNKFSPEQELTEGSKVAAQVYQQMPVLPDNDPVAIYVAQLGGHLAQHAPGARWPYSYHVVASADINAFALPGGAVFVNLGTVQAAETEAQLAGVLAHETSHVILRHSTCNISKQQNRDIAYGVGGILSQILLGSGMAGQAAVAGLSGMRGLQYLHMSRDDEMQADLLGTDLLYDSGYDPRGLPQFFETIQAKYGSGGAQMLSDHPNPGNRTQYVNAEIATLERRPNAMVTSAAFGRAHAAAQGERTFSAQQVKDGAWKSAGYAPAPGYTGGSYSAGNGQGNGGSTVQYGHRGEQQPANDQTNQYNQQAAQKLGPQQLGIGGRFASYRGSDYSISSPAGWQPQPDANGGITLAPNGGAGAFGIVYGAVVGHAKVSGNGVSDADALSTATLQMAQQLSQQNGGLQQIGQATDTTIGGQAAATLELRGRSPLVEGGRTIPEREWLVTVARPDGDLQYVVFVCPERDFPALRPTFTQMMQSLRFTR
ncbi:MAG: M48 family metalloprotease [Acidobacteriota bacterium]|nr:M48 family metalloprotease [Acidobacteriota bacterium]